MAGQTSAGSAPALAGNTAVGKSDYGIATNFVTNRTYVANNRDNTVSVLDNGSGSVVATVAVGAAPTMVAVNPVTNKIYVVNKGSASVAGSVSVINGATNAVAATITIRIDLIAIAINPATNKIYVSSYDDGILDVIDGSTDTLATTVQVGSATVGPTLIRVNPVTNKVFVLLSSSQLAIVDGATNGIDATVTLGSNLSTAYGLDINPVTNHAYVAGTLQNGGAYTGQVWDVAGTGSLANTFSISGSGSGILVAVNVNPLTNKLYLRDTSGSTVYVMNASTGALSATLALPGIPYAIAIDGAGKRVYAAVGGSKLIVLDSVNDTQLYTVTTPSLVYSLSLDPIRHRLYALYRGSTSLAGSVLTYDLSTNATSGISVGSAPGGSAINELTNTVYVPNKNDGTVTIINGSTNATSTVATGPNPIAAAVNPVTNTIYVVNSGAGTGGNSVTAIQGTTNSTSTIAVGTAPGAIAVNAATNKVYVSNTGSNSISVIAGASGTVSTIAVTSAPVAMTVNTATNKIYLANADGSASVLDGATGAVSSVSGPATSMAVAVNSATNKVYFLNSGGSVTVYDATASTYQTVTVGATPGGIAVNPSKNKIYVTSKTSSSVTVIDGAALTTSNVTVGSTPTLLSVNPLTNRVYVVNSGDGTVSVIDGDSLTVKTVTAAGGVSFIAVNATTGKSYASNSTANTVTIIDADLTTTVPITATISGPSDANTISTANVYQTKSTGPALSVSVSSAFASSAIYSGITGASNPTPRSLYYQLDGTAGVWSSVAASGTSNPGSFTLPALTVGYGLHALYVIPAYGDEALAISQQSSSGFASYSLSGTPTPLYFLVASVPAVDHLALSGLPTATTAGASISGTVTAYSDSGSTVATGYTGPVKVTSSDSAATLPSNLTLSNGTATFSVTLKTTPSATVTAADVSGTPTVTSSSVTVNAATVASLTAASGTPQSASGGAAFSSALQVQALDGYSNPVSGVVVSFTAPSSGASAALSASNCTTASNGTCSVTATANTASGTYTVSAASGQLSASFALTNVTSPAAAGVFGSSITPSATYTSIFNAQLNSTNNMVVADQTSSTRFPFHSLLLSGPSYVNTQATSLTVTSFNGAGIDDSGDLTYCYYNTGSTRINTRVPNGSGGYTPTFNIYQTGLTSARCTSGPDGTIYHAPGDGTLNVAVPGGNTFTVTTATGVPAGVTGVTTGLNGNLLLAATGGTYVGKISNGAWSGALVTTRTYYAYAAYQDLNGIIYLEDASTQAAYKYTLTSGSYVESAWTKPFNTTAVAYSYNASGTLMTAMPTQIGLQFASSLTFPAVSVGTADPIEQLVFKVTSAGVLPSLTVTTTGGLSDFSDTGTGTCTTNGAAYSYAVGDLCTVNVKFQPTRGGARTGTVTISNASGVAIATASLAGTGIGATVDHLKFTTVPSSTTPGATFSATVTAYSDAAETTVATFVNNAATVTSSDTLATLPSSASFVNGVATFNVALNTSGSKTITVADAADAQSVTSSGITVAAAVNHFAFTGSAPASTTAGTSFNVTVTAYSDSGNTVATSYTGPVAFTSTDAQAAFPSTLTMSNGVGTFALTLKTVGSQTITVKDSSGSPSLTSSTITVGPGSAATVTASMGNTQSTIVGNAFSTALSVKVTDAYSNVLSGQTVNYSAPSSGASATLSASSCTTAADGTCSITATANSSTGSYNVTASVSGVSSAGTFSLTNSAKTAQTLTFTNPGQQTFGTTPTVTASATSSLAVTFSSTTASVCTVTSAGALTFVSAGTCSISADQAGNSIYAAATTVTRSFTVSAIVPGAPAIGTAQGGSAQATVSFTAPTSSGGANITGYTVTSSPGGFTATGSGSPITVAGLTNGTPYTFTVTAANSAGTGAASVASNSVTPNGTQTITFNNPGTQTYGTTPTLTASSTSGLAVAFTSNTTGVCMVTTGGTLSFSGTGTCTVNADQAGNSSYSTAATVTQSFTVQAASQTITFNVTSPVIYSAGQTITLSATGGASGNAVTFSVVSGPSTINGSTLTVTGAGTLVVAADQTGTSNYNAATQVQRNIVVNAASQTITFTQPSSPITYGVTTSLTLSATSTSGLTPVFSVVSGPGTVSGTTLTSTGAGTIVVAADQAGNANYSAATQVQKSVVVNTAAQTISFTQPASPITYGSSTSVGLSATGGASGNAVTFSLASGPGTISGSMLTFTGAGTLVINADQPGSANYAAATTVQKSVVVSKAISTLTGPATQPVFVVSSQNGSIPVSIAGQYSGTGITAPGGSISYTITNASNAGVASGSLMIANGAVSVPVANSLTPGIYTVTANYAGDTNYASSTPLTVTLQIGQIQPTISWSTPSALTYGATLASVLNAQAFNGTSAVGGTYAYVNGTAAVTAATVLPAGSYSLTVNFTPADMATYKTATGTIALTVNKATPAVSLTPVSTSLLVQNPVTLTATVSSAVSTPTGTVTFLDGTTQLGTSSLVSGVATLTTSTLAVGAHSITAVYSSDANFTAQTSPVSSVQVNDFNLIISTSSAAGSSTSQTVLPGGTATYSFTLSPTGTATFPAAVNLTVSGLPTGATYTISPATIASGAGATNVTLTVTVPKLTALLHTGEKLAPLALAVLLLPFSGRMRRSSRKLMRLAALLVLLIGGTGGVATLTGCGSTTGFFASPQTTYNVTITGTSGALSHSTTVTLTVQ